MNDTIKALTETVRGRVITASDPDYDDARAVYNASAREGKLAADGGEARRGFSARWALPRTPLPGGSQTRRGR